MGVISAIVLLDKKQDMESIMTSQNGQINGIRHTESINIIRDLDYGVVNQVQMIWQTACFALDDLFDLC